MHRYPITILYLVYFVDGFPFSEPSSGGQLANVNIWSRIIPVEVMNTMLWQGDIFSMAPEVITIVSGNIVTDTYTYNVSGM